MNILTGKTKPKVNKNIEFEQTTTDKPLTAPLYNSQAEADAATKPATPPIEPPKGGAEPFISTVPKEEEPITDPNYTGSYGLTRNFGQGEDNYATVQIGEQSFKLNKSEYDSYRNPNSLVGQTDNLRNIYKTLSMVQSPEYAAGGQVQQKRKEVQQQGLYRELPNLAPQNPTSAGEVGLNLGAGAGAMAAGIAAAPLTAGTSLLAGAAVAATKVSTSDREDVRKALKNYKTARSNLKLYINDKTLSIVDKTKYMKDELDHIALAKAQLEYLTRSDLSRWSSGGADELIDIESFTRWWDAVGYNAAMASMTDPNFIPISTSWEETPQNE